MPATNSSIETEIGIWFWWTIDTWFSHIWIVPFFVHTNEAPFLVTITFEPSLMTKVFISLEASSETKLKRPLFLEIRKISERKIRFKLKHVKPVCVPARL